MYKSLQIFFFFFLFAQICFAQWYEVEAPLPEKQDFNSVKFVDMNNGWIVGEAGAILNTTNGGLNWNLQLSDTTFSLKSVCFTDVNNGWVVGSNNQSFGIILKTTNGGTTWSSQIITAAHELDCVFFTDINNGWVVGGIDFDYDYRYGIILKTTNGGKDWVSQLSDTTFSLRSVFFTDTNNGWAVGSSHPVNPGTFYGVILRTTNGGINWTSQLNSTQEEFHSVFFTDSNNCWAAGWRWVPMGGLIRRTTNGGLTWSSQSIHTNSWIIGVTFIDSNNGWAVGYYGRIFNTSDGGATRNEQPILSNHLLNSISSTNRGASSLNEVSFTDLNNGTVVGDWAKILRTTDGGITWMSQDSGMMESLWDVSFANAEIGITVGDCGTIFRTIDGGSSWAQQNSKIGNNFYGVSCIDSNSCTVVGENGIILRTNDGGTNWVVQPSGTTNTLNAVFFSDKNTGTAVGESGIILRTNDGGANWIKQSTITSWWLNDVSFIDSDTGWIVGANEIILKTTNGGINWDLQYGDTSTIGASLLGVSCTDVNICTAVGDNNKILRTTDGGVSWATQSIGTDYLSLNSVCFTDAMTGTIVASSYYSFGRGGPSETETPIFRTTDGGTSWITQIIENPAMLFGVYFTDENYGIAVGGTKILKTTNGGNPVPVELNSFTATANGKEVTLSWSTATELNNQGFEVQRKFGSNGFATIGSVKGHGTTTSLNSYTYVDKLSDAGKYFYRLKQIDYGGKYEYSKEVEINWSPFTNYKLEQNYPNPFNPTTTIGFGIPASPNPSEGGALVQLKVYDVLGNEVRTLINKEMEAGYHSVDFNANDLPSGIYFYQLRVDPERRAGRVFIQTKKMSLLK